MGYTSLTATQLHKIPKTSERQHTVFNNKQAFIFDFFKKTSTNQQAKGNILMDEISISDCQRKCTELIAQLA